MKKSVFSLSLLTALSLSGTLSARTPQAEPLIDRTAEVALENNEDTYDKSGVSSSPSSHLVVSPGIKDLRPEHASKTTAIEATAVFHQDPPIRTGFYIGGQIGAQTFAGSKLRFRFKNYDEITSNKTKRLSQINLALGVNAGFDHIFANNVYVGVEAGVSLINTSKEKSAPFLFSGPGSHPVKHALFAFPKYKAELKTRLGYRIQNTNCIPYLTVGINYSPIHYRFHLYDMGDEGKDHAETIHRKIGPSIGAGCKYFMRENVAFVFEYMYTRLPKNKITYYKDEDEGVEYEGLLCHFPQEHRVNIGFTIHF